MESGQWAFHPMSMSDRQFRHKIRVLFAFCGESNASRTCALRWAPICDIRRISENFPIGQQRLPRAQENEIRRRACRPAPLNTQLPLSFTLLLYASYLLQCTLFTSNSRQNPLLFLPSWTPVFASAQLLDKPLNDDTILLHRSRPHSVQAYWIKCPLSP